MTGLQIKKWGRGIATLLLTAFLAPAGWAQPSIGIVNGLTHENKARAGETYETIIFLKNFGDREARIKIYQTDFYFYADGSQYYSEPGKIDRSNAAWITYYPRRNVIPAGETTEIKCVIAVPDEPSLVGTYWSMIMIEPVPEAGAEEQTIEKDQVRFGIKQLLRYGIQIISHIGETGTRQIKFLNTEFLKEEGKKILQVDVENIGERWLRPVLFVELYDESGQMAGKFEGGKWRIYPGTSVRYRVDLTDVPAGTYKAMIIVDNLDEHVFGAEYTLDIQSGGHEKK